VTTTAATRARRARHRAGVAVAVLVAWAAALVGLVQRDVLRTPAQAYAELGLRVTPGNHFYYVEQDGRPIGWASSTIDTLVDGITVRDELVADLNVGGTVQRAVARTDIRLSRGFALRGFALDLDAAGTPLRVSGRTEGDSAIAFVVEGAGAPADTQRVAVEGPLLVPQLLPLATMLKATPAVGRSATFRAFDPRTLAPKDVTLEILAESLFVVDDSARFDAGTQRWVPARQDSVRAWRLSGEDGTGGGWVDAQGRLVLGEQAGGLTLRRAAYELAFENWRLGAAQRSAGDAAPPAGDILEATAIASDRPLPTGRTTRLRARLTAPDLRGFALDGGRQAFDGSLLTVTVEPESLLTAGYALPPTASHRQRFRAELAAEPLLQVGAQPLVRQAVRIAGDARDPREVVRRLNAWVHDSLAKVPVVSVPNALAVLQDRRGDCNEHAQLFTALARSLGIPTRIASGLAYLDGRFYYHAWAEVYLGDWVAVDPTWGQFPADAAHLRLVTGGLSRQADLLRVLGRLRIDVEEAR
jgi:hypothetical protein